MDQIMIFLIIVNSLITQILTEQYLDCNDICSKRQYQNELMCRPSCLIKSCSIKNIDNQKRIEYCFECLNDYSYEDDEFIYDVNVYLCDTLLFDDLIDQDKYHDRELNFKSFNSLSINRNRVVKTKVNFLTTENNDLCNE